jgi:hypothetical protein
MTNQGRKVVSRRRKWIGLVVFVLLVVFAARAFWPLPSVKFIVSKQTTYFTEPLNPDGTVNYMAAYNEQVGGGVTFDNNLAVPILKALGPGALSDEARDDVLAALSLVLPMEGHYFTTLADHLAANESEYEKLLPPAEEAEEENAQDDPFGQKLRDLMAEAGIAIPQPTPVEKLAQRQLESAVEQPWTAEQYPMLAEWLGVNESVLDEIAAAKARSRFFIPAVSSTNPPEFEGRGHLDKERVRELGQALAGRAMLRISVGDPGGAIDDALALCRLGRLSVGADAASLSGAANFLRLWSAETVIAIARHPNLTSDHAARMLREYQELPCAASAMKADALVMRLMSLDVIMQGLRGKGGAPATRALFQLPRSWGFSANLNNVARQINQFYDSFEEAVSHPDIPKRIEMCSELADANEQLLARLSSQRTGWGMAKIFLASSRAKRRWTEDAMAGVLLSLLSIPPTMEGVQIENQMKEELACLSLALAVYRGDHGCYPAVLAELTPQYMPAIPKDLFNANDLRYESDGRSHKLWSVGRGLTDDGGHERKDIVVEVGE